MHCRGHHQIYEVQSSAQYKSVHTYTFTLQHYIELCVLVQCAIQCDCICRRKWFIFIIISDSSDGSWAAIADCCLQLTWPQMCITGTMKKNMPMAFSYTQIILCALTGNNKQYISTLALYVSSFKLDIPPNTSSFSNIVNLTVTIEISQMWSWEKEIKSIF